MTRTAIISVDGHVKAPRSRYRDYVEQRHLEAFDEWLAAVEAGGRPDRGNMHPDRPDESQWDSALRLADMETQGVVAEVLFSNGVPFQMFAMDDGAVAPDPDLTRAGRMAYSRWLADFCSEAPGRLCGQAAISFDDVDQAVKDVYWAKEQGLGGIAMPGLYPGGTFFFDPALDPIWAAIEEVDLPISQHGGTGSPSYSPPGMASILTLSIEHSFFSGRSLWQMILGGVFDRFPGLRMVFVETEVHWIGNVLQLLDRRTDMGDDWTGFAAFIQRERAFSRRPSEYWESNCFAGVSPFDAGQIDLATLGSDHETGPGDFAIGPQKAMFGADYPHFESIFPATKDKVASLLAAPTVSEADVQRIVFDNAADVYGFDRELLQPHVDRVGFELGELAAAAPAGSVGE